MATTNKWIEAFSITSTNGYRTIAVDLYMSTGERLRVYQYTITPEESKDFPAYDMIRDSIEREYTLITMATDHITLRLEHGNEITYFFKATDEMKIHKEGFFMYISSGVSTIYWASKDGEEEILVMRCKDEKEMEVLASLLRNKSFKRVEQATIKAMSISNKRVKVV
jgi:hypothetical protein